MTHARTPGPAERRAAAPFPVVDLHCDTADRIAWQSLPADLRALCGQDFYGPGDEGDPAGCRELARNRCHVSLERIGGTPWAQCFACFVPDELSPADSVRFYEHVAAHLRSEVARSAGKAVMVAHAGEIRPALEGGRVAVVQTIENARPFAADLGLVARLAEQGLVMASLSWNAAGPLASGHDSHERLGRLGAAAIAEMERERVLLDVSHLNDECLADALALSTRPVVASHSNSRAVCPHPRNLTDRQFLAIRDTGGVVGLNYCSGFLAEGAWGERAAGVGFDEVAAHVEHWLELGGEDAVALGGDLDGATVPSLLDGADRMPAFQAMLVGRFGEAVTRKLCFENALRVLERAGRQQPSQGVV